MLSLIKKGLEIYKESICSKKIAVTDYKIAVLVILIGDAEYKDLFSMCLESIKSYCILNGYEFISYDKKYYEDMPPAWSRIGYLKQIFNQRNDITHVLYLDADVIITNNKFKIEQLIELLENKSKNILFTIDSENNLNDGIGIYKNDRSTIKILDVVENYKEYKDHPQWENAAFMRAVVDNHYCNARILRVCNPRVMNSYIKGRCRWQFGDFIIHFAGINKEDRAILIPAFYNFIKQVDKYVPSVNALHEYYGIGS